MSAVTRPASSPADLAPRGPYLGIPRPARIPVIEPVAFQRHLMTEAAWLAAGQVWVRTNRNVARGWVEVWRPS